MVAKVDLQGCLHDGGRAVDGATVVARGEFPFNGYDDDLRLFGGAREAVDAGIGDGCGVGIEGVFHGMLICKVQLFTTVSFFLGFYDYDH